MLKLKYSMASTYKSDYKARMHNNLKSPLREYVSSVCLCISTNSSIFLVVAAKHLKFSIEYYFLAENR